MSIQEYATSILSIVLGLGVANLLGGVAWMARNPKNILYFYAFGIWCLSILLATLGWWWAIWTIFRDLDVLTFWSFLPTFIVSTFLYLASKILVPHNNESSIRLDENFPEIAKPLCLCIAGLFTTATFISPSQVFSLDGILGIALIGIALLGVVAKSSVQHVCVAAGWVCVYLVQQAIQPDIA